MKIIQVNLLLLCLSTVSLGAIAHAPEHHKKEGAEPPRANDNRVSIFKLTEPQ